MENFFLCSLLIVKFRDKNFSLAKTLCCSQFVCQYLFPVEGVIRGICRRKFSSSKNTPIKCKNEDMLLGNTDVSVPTRWLLLQVSKNISHQIDAFCCTVFAVQLVWHFCVTSLNILCKILVQTNKTASLKLHYMNEYDRGNLLSCE